MTDPGLRLQSLASMAQSLMRSLPLRPLLEMAAEEALSILRAASVSISEVHLDRGIVQTIVNVGDLGPDEVRWPDDEVYVIDEFSRLGQAIHELKTWTESLDDPDCEPHERELLLALGKGSSLATSIVIGDVVWGEFYLTRLAGAPPFDDEAVAYAEVLSAMLGAAVGRSLRETELEVIARRDPLTGLSNRRHLDECAARIFCVPAGAVRRVTALSADVNGLKQINDSYGHARGDAFIRSVAIALVEGFGDLADACIARVGGDEFTVVVADRPVSDLVDRMNAVCRTAWATYPHGGISAGIATAEITDGSGLTSAELFAEADQAQYTAKRIKAREVVAAGGDGPIGDLRPDPSA